MRIFSIVLASALALMAETANSQTVKSQAIASNGVTVNVSSDDFANRYEYSSPAITKSGDSSDVLALVGKVKKQGIMGGVMVQGGITYQGDWRFYNSALFKGGDPADYTVLSRDVVGSCSSDCRVREAFEIDLTPANISKHVENGILPIQIRPTRSTERVLLEIPVAYINAVNEMTAK